MNDKDDNLVNASFGSDAQREAAALFDRLTETERELLEARQRPVHAWASALFWWMLAGVPVAFLLSLFASDGFKWGFVAGVLAALAVSGVAAWWVSRSGRSTEAGGRQWLRL